jgi:superfamily I DNA/RNA helicase
MDGELFPGADPAGLDVEQRAIVEWQARRSLVSAGPGSGKTRLLVGWLASRVESSPEPGRCLALTFTNRAAGELRSRLAMLLRQRASEVTAATFHSFCWSVLRERDPLLSTVFTPSQRSVLLEEIFPARPPARLKTLAERMERFWEGIEEPDSELERAMEAYQQELARIGGADVSSLVSRLLGMLREDAALREDLAARYRVVAVDELQDINRPQYELLMILCGAADAVLCIGDPDQAIYGFRGSDRKLFFDFAAATGARTFRLSCNYRSVEPIVKTADALISAGRATGAPPVKERALSAIRTGGSLIRVARVEDPNEEGRYIASAISDLVGGVDSVSVDAARARGPGVYAFSDIAVLFRLRAVRDALLPALTAAGLPLALGANTPLSEEEPFRSLFAALRLVANPADPVSRRILADHLGHTGTAVSVEEFLSRAPELARKAIGEGIGPVLDDILAGTVTLDRALPQIQLGEQAIRESAEPYGGDLPGFLARVSLYARESEESLRAQRVALLTFHAAKGLEFPVVFIAGAEEGVTPMPDDPDEERRLFYVAMTRARDVLHISHCRRRSVHGEVREAAPSRFLGDIPGSCRVEEAPRRPAQGRQLSLFD